MPPVRSLTPPDSSMARKMRKGTHSCFSCRRRKIRCVFSPERPSSCNECFARGSLCVDQEHAAAEDAAGDRRKNLKERVAQLEAMVESLLDERPEKRAAETLSSLRSVDIGADSLSPDSSSSNLSHGGRGLLLSMFDNAVLSRADTVTSHSEPEPGLPPSRSSRRASARCSPAEGILTPPISDGGIAPSPSAARFRREQARRALLSVLPPRGELMAVLERNGQWWFGWRAYSGIFGVEADVSLVDLATRALSSPDPVLLATLVLCYAASLDHDDIELYLSEVDRWVISDDGAMATLEGLECLTLKCKICMDLGQARRGWVSLRRGLAFAQLLGLHRDGRSSPRRENIWWMLYISDQFMSLLLGLPHGAVAGQHRHIPDPAREGPAGCTKAFQKRVGVMAGHVVDRTQAAAEPSFSSAIDLDQELDALATAMPAGWWDALPEPSEASFPDLVAHLERSFAQLAFHQVRLYLHLPFMLKSAENSRFEYSRSSCVAAAREMLRIYHTLKPRSEVPFYECRVVDFLAFTAAVVVILSLLGYGRLGPLQDEGQDERDWRAIEVSMEILEAGSAHKGGAVAAQSHRALKMLSRARNKDCLDSLSGDSDPVARIVIPYFGTISVRRGQSFNNGRPSYRSAPPSGGHPVGSGPTHPPADPAELLGGMGEDTYVAYDGLYLPNAGYGSSSAGDASFGLPTFSGEGNWWQSLANADINQDWSWFINDGQHSGF